MDERITAEQWTRIDSLLDRLLTLSPRQRRAFLDRETAGDPALRVQLETLLRHTDAGDDRLDRPAAELLARPTPAPPQLPPGCRVGTYRIVALVGRGGMAEVYRAERADGQFEQQVALKLLRADAVETLERFHVERRILAQLDHPGIARLHDGGVYDDGRPYMVMDWVDGQILTDWCRDRAAGLEQRLQLFDQICDAAAHAHRHLLVHRDIKPANVLVTPEGRAKLLDFGVAKRLTAPSDEYTHGTPLTPAYAAPEQWRQGAITTATDVYALGLVLFELLTDARPWSRAGRPFAQMLDQHLHGVAPSASSVAAKQPQAPVSAPRLRGDLDAIIARCLRAEPEHRYETVSALQADLRRYRHAEPVMARRGARAYVLGRFLKRHRWGVAASALLVASLTGGLAAVSWQAQRTETQARRAEAVQAFLVDVFRSNSARQADPVRARATTARELLDIGAAKIDTAMSDAPAAKLSVLQLFAELYDDLELSDSAVRLRTQSAELARELHGAQSRQRAQTLVDLASSMASSRTDTGARLVVLDEARAILDRLGDRDSALRGRLLRKYAELHSGRDAARALDYAQQAVALFERLPPSVDLAESFARLGSEALDARDLPRAVQAYGRAVDVSRSVQGDPNADLPRYYAYLGEAQYRAMDIAGGEHSERTGLELAQRIHGDDSIHVMQLQTRLGKLLLNTGRMHEGLALLRSARALALRISGADDPHHTPQALLLAGYAEATAGHPAVGLADIEAALATVRRQRPGTTYQATMLETAAERCLLEMGRLPQAQAYLDEAGQIRESAGQAPGSAAHNINMRARIQLALDQGRANDAAALLRRLAVEPSDGQQPSFAELDRAVLGARIAFAAGDFDTAISGTTALRGRIEQSGLAAYLGSYLADAALIEARIALDRGHAAAAQGPLQRALALRETTYLADSPRIAEALTALALSHLETGDLAGARTYAGRAAAIQAAHTELAPRYREPLRALQARLGSRSTLHGR